MADSVNATLAFVGQPPSEGVWIMVLVFGWFFCVTGVFGNILIIVTVLTQKALQSAHNFYIVSLAIADLIVCGYNSPFWLLDFLLGRHPVVNDLHCAVNTVILLASYSVSLYNLVLISFNRYLSVCRNSLYVRLFSKNIIILSCVAAWVVAALQAVLPFFELGPTAVAYGRMSHTCMFRPSRVYAATTFINFTLPAILVGFFSMSVLHVWKKSKNRIGQWARGQNQGRTTQRISASDVAMIRSLVLVFALLVVLYLPAAISLILHISLRITNSGPDLSACLMLLMFMNHSINWVVYGVMNKNFKDGYRRRIKMCCGRAQDVPNDTDTERTRSNRTQRTLAKNTPPTAVSNV